MVGQQYADLPLLPGWRRLGPPDRFPSKGVPALAFDARGRAVAAWGESPSAAVVRRYDPGAGWAVLARFVPEGAGEYLPSTLAFDSLGRGVVGIKQDTDERFGPSAVAAALFDGKTWGEVSVLTDRSVTITSPVAAMSAQGGLLAWNQVRQADGSQDVVISTFTAGSAFGLPKVITTSPATASVSVAMNEQGQAFAAWIQTPSQQQEAVFQVWYAAGAWGTPQPLQTGSDSGQSPTSWQMLLAMRS